MMGTLACGAMLLCSSAPREAHTHREPRAGPEGSKGCHVAQVRCCSSKKRVPLSFTHPHAVQTASRSGESVGWHSRRGPSICRWRSPPSRDHVAATKRSKALASHRPCHLTPALGEGTRATALPRLPIRTARFGRGARPNGHTRHRCGTRHGPCGVSRVRSGALSLD